MRGVDENNTYADNVLSYRQSCPWQDGDICRSVLIGPHVDTLDLVNR